MCTQIGMPDGSVLETIGDAIRRFGANKVATVARSYPVSAYRTDENCLCCIDVDETARLNGYRVTSDEHDPMVRWLEADGEAAERA